MLSLRPALAVFHLAMLAMAHGGEISWNVQLSHTFADGITVQRAAFSDGGTKYALSIDGETTAEIVGAGSRFTYKGVPSATFEIQPSAIVPVLPFNEDTLERYRSAARLRAPNGVGKLTDVEEIADPLSINGWRSFRVSYAYSQHGQQVRKSVTFLTLANGQQAVLETSAYKPEFEAAMERSDYLIRSWHELALTAGTPAS